MVVATAMHVRSEAGGISFGRLPLFVTVSILVNLGIANSVGNHSVPEIMPVDPPMLRINLNVRAAPQPTPSVGKTAAPTVSSQALLSVETTATAREKIATSEPVTKSKPLALPIPKPLPKTNTAQLPRKPSRPKSDVPAPKQQKIAEDKSIADADNDEVRAPSPSVKTPSQIDATTDDAGVSNSTVTHKARYRRQTSPVYPRRAYDLGQQGTVLLFAQVLPSGRPGELKVAQSSGHNLLDMSALAAVRAWEFEPNSVNGNVVATWVHVPVRFVIQ